MTPEESLAYLTQVCNDYGRTLPPSAAMPFQQAAQAAINTLHGLVNPPPAEAEPPRPGLHAVPGDAP